MKRNIEEKLIEAGWYTNRKVDISSIEKAYKENGFTMPDNVKKFLQEFGFLEIKYKMKSLNEIEKHDFNPVGILGEGWDYEYFQSIADNEHPILPKDDELFPVGNVSYSNMVLLMTKSNKFYCYTPGDAVMLGESIDEMMDTLLYN